MAMRQYRHSPNHNVLGVPDGRSKGGGRFAPSDHQVPTSERFPTPKSKEEREREHKAELEAAHRRALEQIAARDAGVVQTVKRSITGRVLEATAGQAELDRQKAALRDNGARTSQEKTAKMSGAYTRAFQKLKDSQRNTMREGAIDEVVAKEEGKVHKGMAKHLEDLGFERRGHYGRFSALYQHPDHPDHRIDLHNARWTHKRYDIFQDTHPNGFHERDGSGKGSLEKHLRREIPLWNSRKQWDEEH
jgi:hypothetical protein